MPDLIWEIDDEDGVFLTFDDGPTPGVTEWILSTLDKYDAKATFFVLGKNVEMYPDLYKRILDAGHKVGNHTYSHQKGWGMSLERYTEDVDFANDLIHSELFRPPYARITPAQARFLGQRYKLVMWDIISRDYNRRLSPRTCLKNVTKHLAPGAIVVFHDSEKAFRNMRYALPRTLEKIRQMGLKCKAIGALRPFCGRLQRAGPGNREFPDFFRNFAARKTTIINHIPMTITAIFDIKIGMCIEMDGKTFLVVDFSTANRAKALPSSVRNSRIWKTAACWKTPSLVGKPEDRAGARRVRPYQFTYEDDLGAPGLRSGSRRHDKTRKRRIRQ